MSGTVGIISSLAVWSWMELAVAGLEMAGISVVAGLVVAGISVEVGMVVGSTQNQRLVEAGEAENTA